MVFNPVRGEFSLVGCLLWHAVSYRRSCRNFGIIIPDTSEYALFQVRIPMVSISAHPVPVLDFICHITECNDSNPEYVISHD